MKKINGEFMTIGSRRYYVITGPNVYRRIPV